MGWVQTASNNDFMCYEFNTKSISCRIESRKTQDGWTIYKSYYSDKGLNFTEEFVAPTDDKMKQVVRTLQRAKQPTVDEIRKLILEKSKRVQVHVEREFKEYNVEKWRFGINKDASINFALVRTYDEVDIDFVMHDSYKLQETQIVREVVSILGFDGMEDVLNIQLFYFSKAKEKVLPSQNKTLDLY